MSLGNYEIFPILRIIRILIFLVQRQHWIARKFWETFWEIFFLNYIYPVSLLKVFSTFFRVFLPFAWQFFFAKSLSYALGNLISNDFGNSFDNSFVVSHLFFFKSILIFFGSSLLNLSIIHLETASTISLGVSLANTTANSSKGITEVISPTILRISLVIINNKQVFWKAICSSFDDLRCNCIGNCIFLNLPSNSSVDLFENYLVNSLSNFYRMASGNFFMPFFGNFFFERLTQGFP